MPGEPPDLRPGDANEWVAELQRLLRLREHFHGDPDGTFDDDTERAVAEFRAARGDAADGPVGRATWDALYAAAPAEHYGAVEPAFDDQPAAGSPAADGGPAADGHWVWDGERWVGATGGDTPPAVQNGATEAGQLSEDRQWRWDGIEWQPANQ
jgi:peptidoglycan hydrolase-like protein with peptidoglycan-binding domain